MEDEETSVRGSTHDGERTLAHFDYAGDKVGRRSSMGGLIAVAAQTAKMIIQIAGLAILARLLRPQDFGLVAMAGTVAGFIALFGDLGLSTATLQRRSISQRTVSTLFFLGLGVALLVTLAAILISGPAARFYQDERVASLCIGLSLAIPIAAAGAQHNALLARGMRWYAIQAAAIGGQAIGLIAAIVAASVFNAGYWALVLQSIAAQSVTTSLQWISCRWRPSLVLNIRSSLSEVAFGANATGFAITNYFHRQADNVLIGKRWGETELGCYTRAYTIVTLPTLLVNSAVGSAVIPLLSRCQDDKDAWRLYLLRAISFTCFAAYLMACELAINSREIVAIVLGPHWDYTGDILRYLSLSLFALTPMNTMGWVFVSLGATGRWFAWGALTAVVFPTAYFFGLSFHSPGVAISYAVAATLLSVPCVYYALRGSPAYPADVGRAVRSPLLASAATLGGAGLLKGYWTLQSPLVSFMLGSVVTVVIFGVAVLVSLFLDRAQFANRRLLWSVVRRA